MAGHDDEEFYDDDDLDALPDSEFLKLEVTAIQFTQAQTQAARVVPAPSSDYGDEFDEVNFEDDEVVIDESRNTAPIATSIHRGVPGQATQHEQFRQQRYGTINNSNSTPTQLANRPRPTPPRFHESSQAQVQPVVPLDDSLVVPQDSQPSGVKVESLQRQLQELIKERDNLKTELKSKAGEISIVRSKQDQIVKNYERELTYTRKHNEETLEKQRKELEAARNAQKAAVTERDFISRDLAEESERVRRLNKAKEAEKKNPTTPKKKQALPHRDGFDDDEIEIISPSKVSPSWRVNRRHHGSPSKPGRRKRKAVESPAGALPVVQLKQQSEEQSLVAEAIEVKVPIQYEAMLARLSVRDGRFDFIGNILDHKYDAKHLRTLEELGKYAFPSASKNSIQSLILAEIPTFGLKKESIKLQVDFCELLISLWKKCIEERYVDPMYLLIDMITFALELHTTDIAPFIIDSIQPVAQDTVDMVTVNRFKSAVELEPWAEAINPTEALHLLYLTAQGCMSDPKTIRRFWKQMRWRFGPVNLSTNQPEEDYLIMAKLLSTSVMKDSFGAICGGQEQDFQMELIINTITYSFHEIPKTRNTNDPYPPDQLYRLRLQALQLLISMTRSPVASKAIIVHDWALAKLVSLVSNQLDELYDYKSNTKECSRLINLAMRLIFHLVTKHEDQINMQLKLAAIPGGSQKYLLTLSRLNFSEEDLVLESGIDADINLCALELLERFVSPEEADAIHDAFSAP